MKKYVWFIKRNIQESIRILGKKIRSFYIPITEQSLKSFTYEELPSPVDWAPVAQGRKLFVEIGSGHGEVLLSNNEKDSISIGYETKTRFFKLSSRKLRKRMDAYIYQGNGYEGSLIHFARLSIDAIFILFPDPWHKKRHAKRRPIISSYFKAIAQNVKKGGRIIIATDWSEYAEFIWSEMQKVTDIYDLSKDEYTPQRWNLPVTHFHQKWVRKGRSFTEFVLVKKG